MGVIVWCCRSAGAGGAGAGHQDAADPEQAVLSGCEAEPTGPVHQGGRGDLILVFVKRGRGC